MSSKTQIANLAIAHLGTAKLISNVETESSTEAIICRQYLDTAIEASLRDFNWPFATRIIALSLIETFSTGEWKYSYRYPSDCLRIKRILSGIRNDTNQSRVPYKVLKDDAARIVYVDEENAEAEYTQRVLDPSFFPPDFQMALSYRLAMYISPTLSKGESLSVIKNLNTLYEIELSRAMASSINEEQVDVEVESEFTRART